MDHPPRISDAEWEVMNVIWKHHPITAQEVARELCDRRQWSERTVKSLLSRLLRKGALTYEQEGKRYRYRPLIRREPCVRAESESFMNRVFGGSPSPLVAWFLKSGRLSDSDIEELRRLLAEKEGPQ